MTVSDKARLLHGPHKTPAVHVGARVLCEFRDAQRACGGGAAGRGG
jgi:hypothetical protein